VKTLLLVGLTVAVMCTAASAGSSYMGPYGEMVYQLNAPTGWAVSHEGDNVVLPGAGPDGGDAWYRPGANHPPGSGDDSSQAYWNFSFADLPNVGHDLVPGEYQIQTYVSNYGGLPHEDNGVYGTRNGPWGWNYYGAFSSWNGAGQGDLGWQNIGAWVGGYAWLSKTGDPLDMQVAAKWNPWGGYGGLAVSGVRISKALPEPSSLLALLAGFPALALLRRRR